MRKLEGILFRRKGTYEVPVHMRVHVARLEKTDKMILWLRGEKAFNLIPCGPFKDVGLYLKDRKERKVLWVVEVQVWGEC